MAHRKNKASEKYSRYDEIAQKLKGRVPDEVEHHHTQGGEGTRLRRTLNIRTTPIVIGIPMDELMFSQFLSNLICLSVMPWDSFITTADTFVNDARNIIHDSFLENSKAPYLFMLDSDVLPPPDVIERLLVHNLPVVAGWYRKKEKFRIKNLDGVERVVQRPVVYDYNRFDENTQKFMFTARVDPKTGLEKVDGVGAGCLLLKREVCEKVGKSPFSLLYGGEDLTFCRKLTGAGYDIYVDWDCACAHIGSFYV